MQPPLVFVIIAPSKRMSCLSNHQKEIFYEQEMFFLETSFTEVLKCQKKEKFYEQEKFFLEKSSTKVSKCLLGQK